MFKVHMLNHKGIEKAVQIEHAFDTLVDKIKDFVDDDRCLALTLTKLEEASFYAKKGMAMGKINQQKEGL